MNLLLQNDVENIENDDAKESVPESLNKLNVMLVCNMDQLKQKIVNTFSKRYDIQTCHKLAVELQQYFVYHQFDEWNDIVDDICNSYNHCCCKEVIFKVLNLKNQHQKYDSYQQLRQCFFQPKPDYNVRICTDIMTVFTNQFNEKMANKILQLFNQIVNKQEFDCDLIIDDVEDIEKSTIISYINEHMNDAEFQDHEIDRVIMSSTIQYICQDKTEELLKIASQNISNNIRKTGEVSKKKMIADTGTVVYNKLYSDAGNGNHHDICSGDSDQSEYIFEHKDEEDNIMNELINDSRLLCSAEIEEMNNDDERKDSVRLDSKIVSKMKDIVANTWDQAKEMEKYKIKYVRAQDNYLSYDPMKKVRAKDKIFISKEIMQDIEVMTKKKFPNLHAYLDKSLVFHGYIKHRIKGKFNKSIWFVNYGFVSAETNENLYCIIEEKMRGMKKRKPWSLFDLKMRNKVITSTQIRNRYSVLSDKLPGSANFDSYCISELDYPKVSALASCIGYCEWYNLSIYKRNSARTVELWLPNDQFIKGLKSYFQQIDCIRLIPIVMFGNEDAPLIHHVIIVRIDVCTDIGISIRIRVRNKKVIQNKLTITGIHLDKELIDEQHKLALPSHSNCSCLAHWVSNITDLVIQNPNIEEDTSNENCMCNSNSVYSNDSAQSQNTLNGIPDIPESVLPSLSTLLNAHIMSTKLWNACD